eukprot:1181991-Prymnesium_polylepis.1
MPGQSGFHLNPHHSPGGSRHQPGHPSLRSIQDASQVLAPTGRTVLGMCLTCMVIFIGSPTTLDQRAQPRHASVPMATLYNWQTCFAPRAQPRHASVPMATLCFSLRSTMGSASWDCSHSRNLVPVQSTGRCTSISEDRARQQLRGSGCEATVRGSGCGEHVGVRGFTWEHVGTRQGGGSTSHRAIVVLRQENQSRGGGEGA